MKLFSFGFCLVISACLPGFVNANDAPPNNEQLAKKMFDEGLRHFDNNAYDDAAKAFRKANELNFHWKVLYNIAQSEAAAKRFGLALAAFEAYLSRGGDDIPILRNDEVIAEIARLRMMCGYVEITAPDGATISIDTIYRGQAPISSPLPLAASVAHELVVSIDNDNVYRQTISVTGGQVTRVVVPNESGEAAVMAPSENQYNSDTQPLPSAAAATDNEQSHPRLPASSAQPSQSRFLKILGIAGIATGVSMAIGGAIVGAKAHRDSDSLKSKCGGTSCTENYHDDVDDLETLDNVGAVLIGAGVAVAVTGGVFLLLHKRRKDRLSNVTAGAAVSPGMGALKMEWRF